MRSAVIASIVGLGVALSPAMSRAWAGMADAQAVKLASCVDEKSMMLSELKGSWAIVHLLSPGESERAATHVKQYIKEWPRLAGARHVFVHRGDHHAAQEWAKQFKKEAAVVHDDGTLLKELKAEDAAMVPATIILNPSGKEISRYIGADSGDYFDFESLKGRLEAKRKAPLDHYNIPKSRVAVQGYDVTAYFTAGSAVMGDAGITSVYKGVTYQFASEAARKMFAESPDSYAPTFGGWCASAIADKAEKVEIDPTNFKVTGGRLFLFYKSFFADALKDWNKHEASWEPQADTNWKSISGEDAVKPPPKKAETKKPEPAKSDAKK